MPVFTFERKSCVKLLLHAHVNGFERKKFLHVDIYDYDYCYVFEKDISPVIALFFSNVN